MSRLNQTGRILIAITALASVLVAVLASSRVVLTRAFIRLEDDHMSEHAVRVTHALEDEVLELSRMAGDWSAWDETYAFVQGRQPGYVEENLTEATFAELQLTLLLVTDARGQIVYGSGFDLDAERHAPIPAGVEAMLSRGDFRPSALDQNTRITGIVLLPDGPMMVAARPILTSARQGPARGLLVLGRGLSAGGIAHLAEVTHLPLTAHRFDAPDLPADLSTVRDSLVSGAPTWVRTLGEDTIASYALVRDVYGDPALILRVVGAREIYRQGQATIVYFVGWFLSLGLVFACTTQWLLNRLVLSRRQRQESDERYRHLLNLSPDAVTITDAALKITFCNARAVAMVGAKAPERLVGRNALEWIAPEEVARIRKSAQRAWTEGNLQQGNLQNVECSVMRQDGSRFPVEFSVAPIRGTDGQPTAFVAMARDITERKRAEEELLRLRKAVDASGEVIFLTDREGVITFVNPEFTRLYGYGAAEVLGRATPRILKSGTLGPEKYELFWQTLLSKRSFRGELVNRTKDGRLIHIDGSATPVLDEAGDIVGFLAIQRDIGERRQAEEKIRRQLQRLAALRDIDMAINSSLDQRLTLSVFLDRALAQLGVDAIAVLLLGPHSRTLEYAAGRGFRTDEIARVQLHPGEGVAGRAVTERRPIRHLGLPVTGDGPAHPADLPGEGFVAYYAVPLIAKGQVKGVVEAFHRAPFDPDAEWIDFMETLAGQAAIAIDNSRMLNELQRANAELALAYESTLEGWGRALDLRDHDTEGHAQRVTGLAVRLASAVGVSGRELPHLRRGALLHDIGKMGVPDSVLLKPGPLTVDEWAAMRQHPQHAYDMLFPIQFLRPALDIPYCHHEKWDGTGYPRGLKGKQIPLAARVFSIVDVWDALRSDRPYRKAWPAEAVCAHMRSQAGKHFDPEILHVFLHDVLAELTASPGP